MNSSIVVKPRLRLWQVFLLASVVVSSNSLSAACQSEFDVSRLGRVDTIAEQHIASKQIPGCVIAIGNSDGNSMLKAYGSRQLYPKPQAMTVDTVFDLASLTKPIATATAIMCLIEDGKLRLEDRIADFLPEFGQNGKNEITVRQLLIHTGGLIPDNAISDYEQSPDIAWQNICKLKLNYPVGANFSYSDVGFIVLAKLIEELSSQNLDEFTQQRIFSPLQMGETQFKPSELLRQRAAPTEKRNGSWIVGEVHDPRAFRLNGIAGHAGLFSTATDLGRFARMLLHDGKLGKRVLSFRTVQLMTSSKQTPRGIRGLGWDIRSPFSSNRSDLYSERAFGHGGFTGTSFWVDPELDLYVIVLSNRVHPDGKGRMNKLAARVGSIAVSSLKTHGLESSRSTGEVKLGIDRLQSGRFEYLRNKRVGLITNHTGMNSDGVSTVKILQQEAHINLVKLFSPEHGFTGKLDQAAIIDSVDQSSGLQVLSLYGKNRMPQLADLQNIDVLVFDIQDVGTRFYTYISTMGLAMQAAAEADIDFVVLDRPNPIGGEIANGPMADSDKLGFIAFHDIPIRHGMTIGELAKMFNSELQLNLRLSVVPMLNWKRDMHWDHTGLMWINPSPNMRSPRQALLYPGIGLLEMTNLSVGRGTDKPFEWFGAPWIDCRVLAAKLNSLNLAGVGFMPIQFSPRSSKYAGELCNGVLIEIRDQLKFQPIETGIHIATLLWEIYEDEWEIDSYRKLLANKNIFNQIHQGTPAKEVIDSWQDSLQKFELRRAKHLLYD